jgi:hypothetical protein
MRYAALACVLLSFPAFAEEEFEQVLQDENLAHEVSGAATAPAGGAGAGYTQAAYANQTYDGASVLSDMPPPSANAAPPPMLGLLPPDFINAISRPDAGR